MFHARKARVSKARVPDAKPYGNLQDFTVR